jgi:16S rRNA processing protein RimM
MASPANNEQVSDDSRVVVAEILRPRGNRGEVLAASLSDVPGRLENLKRASVRLANGTDVPVEIEEAWPYKDLWVFKFAGVDSIDDAERFSSSDLWIPASERGELPEGDYFRSDLIGCSIVNDVDSQRIGVVRGWQQYGGPALLQADVNGREVLIPFVPEICPRVDIGTKTISVILPDGLLDI